MKQPDIAQTVTYTILFLWVIITILSCQRNQENSTTSKNTTTSNFTDEAKKLLKHYSRQRKDSLKLEAAKFLINNMPGQQTFKPDFDKTKAELCALVSRTKDDTIVKRNTREDQIKLISENNQLRNEFENISYAEDTTTIKAEDLIDNIEYAFAARERYPWCKNIKWGDFLNFVLPPKIYNEKYNRYWRRDIMKRYDWLKDSIQNNTNIQSVSMLINNSIANDIKYDPSLRFVPNILNYYDLRKLKVGKCEHLVTYNVYILRALGIPTMVDYTPAWANNSSGHTWGSIKTETGKILTFDALYPEANKIASNKIPEGILRKRKTAKIYRVSYKLTEKTKQKEDSTVPKQFYDPHTLDVTSEYDIEQIKKFTFLIQKDLGSSPLFLCVYNTNSWIPTAIGDKQSIKTYQFTNIGSGIMYLAAIKTGENFRPVSPPFLLTKSGMVHFFNPGKKIETPIVLKRKSVVDYDLNLALQKLIGGQIQGSNDQNFSSSEILYRIETQPMPNYNIYKVSNRGLYRYFRYVQPNSKCRVAELSFFGNITTQITRIDSKQKLSTTQLEGTYIASAHTVKSDPSKSQDDDLLTYYVSNANKNGYLGIDLGTDKKAILKTVKLYPPNDGNSIIPGDMYELFYWNGEWTSLGNIVAKGESLTFDNYPANAVFRLKNLTRGYKERIFTIQEGTQEWW